MNSNTLNIALVFGTLIALVKFLSPDIKEGFGTLPARTFKLNRVAQQPGSAMFEVPGNYQASLSPRMSNVNYGAFIRYNTPSNEQMAANPKDPLSIYNAPISIKENYCGAGQPSNSAQSMGMQKPPMDQSYTEVTDLLPVNGLGGATVNALGEQVTQPIIYDRFIFANQKSRLRGLGDPIRGDLPIVPVRNEWFRPSVAPNIDLQSGALAVIGGLNMDTTKEVLALQNASAGGLLDVGSGVDYSVQQSPYTTTAGGDVQVSAFP